MKRYLHSRAFGLFVLIAMLIVLIVALWPGLPVPPEPPPPPDWLNRLAVDVLEWLAPKLYWLLFVAFLVIWGVLNWQRIVGESAAARWNRRLYLVMWLLWLTLAVGRTVFQEWLVVGYALIVVLIAIVSLGAVLAVLATYAVPLWRCRGGRCEVPTAPAVDGMILPHARPWNAARDGERRVKERRKNWPPNPRLN